ncbi:MAG: hypothetical protein P8012_16555 [Desulfobacterales bacterium]
MRRNIIICILFVCFLLKSNGICQTSADENIVHLNLRITSNKIELLNTKITAGRLKSFHQKNNFSKNNIYFEIFADDGKRIYNSTIPNPFIRYLESADENGNISSVRIILDTAFVSIRIPYHPKINHVDFFKLSGENIENRLSANELQKIDSIVLNIKKEND